MELNDAMDELTVALCSWDVSTRWTQADAYADEVVKVVTDTWDTGADLVCLPEFTWQGLEPLLTTGADPLRAVAKAFWQEQLPRLLPRLSRPGKAAVLGSCPFILEQEDSLRNRAAVVLEGELFHQDKLHLTPWEKAFSAGECVQLFEFRGFRCAVIICLDIEIPELSASLRGHELDLVLCPSATETELGVERVHRCASARAVELGCYVGVCQLLGGCQSELIDENIGRLAAYRPSQHAFGKAPRNDEAELQTSGQHQLSLTISSRALNRTRKNQVETNPALLNIKPGTIYRTSP